MYNDNENRDPNEFENQNAQAPTPAEQPKTPPAQEAPAPYNPNNTYPVQNNNAPAGDAPNPNPYTAPQPENRPYEEPGRNEIVYDNNDNRGYNAHYTTPPAPQNNGNNNNNNKNNSTKTITIVLAVVLGVIALVFLGIGIWKNADKLSSWFPNRFDYDHNLFDEDEDEEKNEAEDEKEKKDPFVMEVPGSENQEDEKTDDEKSEDEKSEDEKSEDEKFEDEKAEDEKPEDEEDNTPVVSVPNEEDNEKSDDVVIEHKPDTIKKTPLSVHEIAQKCTKSSVGIMVEVSEYYFGREYKSRGVGSGFILSEDGYIATNNHVVSGASKITVVLNDGTEYDAKIVGADSITDIAVVKIEAEGLPVLERGNSDEVLVGDLAVAIGTPASIKLAGTVTSGIISAVDRKIDMTDSTGKVVKTMTLIQTNATINPGNSGGPLINCYGQVIGINTLKLTAEYEGIGFAIPINGAIKIMNQLIADGTVSDRSDGLVVGTATIGIECADVTKQEAEYYGIPQGVLVMQINKNGSAAKAGLRRGDIIVAFNGQKVKTTEEINSIKLEHNVGDKVTLTIFRDGTGEIDITFNLDMQAQ